jgi:hypothetical protein
VKLQNGDLYAIIMIPLTTLALGLGETGFGWKWSLVYFVCITTFTLCLRAWVNWLFNPRRSTDPKKYPFGDPSFEKFDEIEKVDRMKLAYWEGYFLKMRSDDAPECIGSYRQGLRDRVEDDNITRRGW